MEGKHVLKCFVGFGPGCLEQRWTLCSNNTHKMDFPCERNFFPPSFFKAQILHHVSTSPQWLELHDLVNEETGSALQYFQIPEAMEEDLRV